MFETLQKLFPLAVSLPLIPKLALSGLVIFVAILLLALLWSPQKVSDDAASISVTGFERTATQSPGETESRTPIASGDVATELTVFNSSAGVDGFSVVGRPAYVWTGKGSNAKPVGNEGEGNLSYESGGILSVQRSNTEGRYELRFQQYSYGDRLHSALPMDKLATGNRGINVTCHAKVVGSEHTLRFTLKTMDGKQLSDFTQKVTRNEWVPINAYLEAPHSEEVQVRIYDEQLVAAPSSIQIKDIVIKLRNI